MDKKYIRFIDSNYKTLFHVPDGGEIKVHSSWDNNDRVLGCKYIDEYHVDISGNCYHICQFAELMERNGNTYEPLKEIGDLEFYEKRYYDHENVGPDGKLVPYYELYKSKNGRDEFKFNYCLEPSEKDKTYCMFTKSAEQEICKAVFSSTIEAYGLDEKLTTRLKNIVQAIENEQRPTLPERCYSILESTGEIIVLARGKSGYYKTDFSSSDKAFNKQFVNERNEALGVTKAQAAAMYAGSMFGWDTPAANPSFYDEHGNLKPMPPTSLAQKISSAEQQKTCVSSNDGYAIKREESR